MELSLERFNPYRVLLAFRPSCIAGGCFISHRVLIPYRVLLAFRRSALDCGANAKPVLIPYRVLLAFRPIDGRAKSIAQHKF